MAAIINQDQNRNQDQSLLIETGKFVITTLVIGAVVTTTGSASIPIGIGAVIIGQDGRHLNNKAAI
ncbi:7180_t:CDS:2 [Entrophospora sp. SA101]|nr:7180_t:CDS:2 [Entrophospora sp. SA101]CAJ0873904.1 4868_t:CDS:2 [Entrophospora sp. SA101]